MKTADKLLVAAAAGFLAGLVIYMVRRAEEKRVLSEVSNEGYETAYDVLFPDRLKATGRRLHYGPVLPE